jgi:hypothetical protein
VEQTALVKFCRRLIHSWKGLEYLLYNGLTLIIGQEAWLHIVHDAHRYQFRCLDALATKKNAQYHPLPRLFQGINIEDEVAKTIGDEALPV